MSYTLTGSDMFRVRDNGQIEVSDEADLNYETSTSHTVMLMATDTSGGSNNSATIEVTIHVTDLDERPVITEGVLTLTGPTGSQEYSENGTEADRYLHNGRPRSCRSHHGAHGRGRRRLEARGFGHEPYA